MKIDLHVHTSEASLCGQISGEDTARAYRDAGYDLVVLTNHMTSWYVGKPYRDKGIYSPKLFDEAYEIFAEAGEKCGLRTLKGMEYNVPGTGDFLIYGDSRFITDRFPEIFDINVRTLGELCRENGALLYQAHPFRDDIRIVDPQLLFGIEVINGAKCHDSRNDIATAWAEKYGLHRVAGSDSHQLIQVGTAGVVTGMDIRTNDDLLEMLRTDNYTVFGE